MSYGIIWGNCEQDWSKVRFERKTCKSCKKSVLRTENETFQEKGPEKSPGGLPSWLRWQRIHLLMQETWVGMIPWRRKWQPTPEFLPGESHGQRSLGGHSPWSLKRAGHDWLTSLLGTDAMIFVIWMLSFKPTFSLSSFTFDKRLFSSSPLW